MHDHSHSHLPLTPMHKEKKAFYWALLIAFIFMVLEIVGGFIANSLALISDGLHMFTDVGALFLGILVIKIFNKPPSVKKTYGYQRAEILGALTSAAILWVLMFFLIYEAILRLLTPHEVEGPVVLIIALLGLFANLIMAKLLHPGEKGSLNIKAAYLHVLGDLLGSIGVIISGIIIWTTGWNTIDPIITFFIAILILYSSGKLLLNTINILMEGVPEHIDYKKIKKDLLSIEGVDAIHDLHIWSVSTQKVCLSVHIVSHNSEKNILEKVHELLRTNHQIPHMTIQIENAKDFAPCYCYDCQKD